MEPENLWRSYPVLNHIAWGGSWPNIKANRLLSTRALLRVYRKDGQEIARLTRRRRGHWFRIGCPGMPEAVLRDEKPMFFCPTQIESLPLLEVFHGLAPLVGFFQLAILSASTTAKDVLPELFVFVRFYRPSPRCEGLGRG